MLVRPGALSLDQLQAIHAGGHTLVMDPAALPNILASAAVVKRAAEGQAPVYGVNTGFGKLASTRISEADLATLQLNLIRSHSVGVGKPLAAPVMRLMLALKAASLARGYSGVRPVSTSFRRGQAVRAQPAARPAPSTIKVRTRMEAPEDRYAGRRLGIPGRY